MKDTVLVVDQYRFQGGVDAVALGDLHFWFGKAHRDVEYDLFIDRLAALNIAPKINGRTRE